MTLLLFGILSLAIGLFYAIKVIGYAKALSEIKSDSVEIQVDCDLKVSLIIPLRNEMPSLPGLLSDLENQDYFPGNYEVIFVDDHSDDGSTEFMDRKCKEVENWQLLGLKEHLEGKKRALHEGILAASGDWIIQTDADCRIPSGFISGHAKKAVQSQALLISGPVFTDYLGSLWNRFEALDHMSLSGTGIASFLKGKPMLCSAANLSYRRNFYLGIADKLLRVPSTSGDDIFLMIEAKKQKGNLSVLCSPEHAVITLPAGSPLTFLKQRIRWGSKAKYFNDSGLIQLALIVFLSNLLLSTGLVLSIFYPPLFWIFLATYLIKSSADFSLLYFTARAFKMKRLLWIFPLLSLFYYFYVTLAAFLSFVGNYRWKGRGNTSNEPSVYRDNN